MSTPFFSYLNKALRDKDRDVLKPWFSYLKLIIHALQKLPSLELDVWRGVVGDIGSKFVKNGIQTWWSVNSCTTDLNVVECYLGDEGTIFSIKTRYGKDISSFSMSTAECEVVLMPGTRLCVTGDTLNFKDRLFLVPLHEEYQCIQEEPKPISIQQSLQLSQLPMAEITEAMTQRVTDFPAESLEILPRISGYDTVPLVSLEEAVQPLVSLLPAVQNYAYMAKQNCTNPADGLTQNESAAIMLYTMSWQPLDQSLYHVLNATLRSTSRQQLQPWFPYLKLLFTALARLPSIGNRTVYRGVKLDLYSKYSTRDTIVWWGFTSCTASINVLQSEIFLGKTGSRTMFAIETDAGINIRNHSYFKTEDEVLLLPARQFKIHGCLDQGAGLHVIQLKEIQPPNPLLQAVTVERIYSDGSHYIGNLQGNMRHGRGICYYANSESYEGEWAYDSTNGEGIRKFSSGNRYIGTERDNKRHGYGVSYLANGEKYEGNWINDKMNGHGKYTWPKNIEYEGTFRDDKKHGPGTLKFANGRIKQGIWQNDRLIDTRIQQGRSPASCTIT